MKTTNNITRYAALLMAFLLFAMPMSVNIMAAWGESEGTYANWTELANKMEEVTKTTEGIKDAVVNFMTLKMKVDFEEGVDPSEVMEKVRKNCKKIEDDIEIFI